MVRIPGFHPGGPGSIPGMGTFFFCWFGFITYNSLFFTNFTCASTHAHFFFNAYLHPTTITGCYDGCVYCLKSDSGRICWRLRLSSEPVKSSACIDEAMAWIGSHDHYLYGIDVKVGWQ